MPKGEPSFANPRLRDGRRISNEQGAQKMVDAIASAGADVDRSQKSGDANAQAQADINALNAIVRGGKVAVTPIARDQLKTLLPDSAASYAYVERE